MRRKILIIRFGSLGDVILTSSTVRNLTINFPDAEITYLTKARFAPIVRLIDGVAHVETIRDNPSVQEWHDTIDRLDYRQFDTIIDLQGKLSSWLVRKLVTANTRLIYPKRRLERYRLVRTHEIPSTWPHTIDLYNSLVLQMGGEIYCRRPQLSVNPHESTDSIWPENEPALIVAPGAAHATKQWPTERFAQSAVDLHRRHKLHVVWVTESEELPPDALRGIPSSHRHAISGWSADQLAVLFARATVMVANDSGLMHLASAVNLPVVAIFGPTHPALGFAPRGLEDRVVEVDEPCRPCSLHGKKPCFRDEQYCFTRIGPDLVSDEVSAVIERRLHASPALFVDRDGTILVNKHYRNDPDQVEFERGAQEGLRLAAEAGYKIIMISNQSGIARGLTTEAEVIATNARVADRLRQAGISVAGDYYCPHHATEGKVKQYSMACDCRKPAPGMIERAALEHNIDLRKSAVIGDSPVDIHLGQATGMRPILVRTGYGLTTEAKLAASGKAKGLLVGDDLLAAVRCLLENRHD